MPVHWSWFHSSSAPTYHVHGRQKDTTTFLHRSLTVPFPLMSSSVLFIREGTDSIHPKAAHRHGRAAWYNQERLRTFIHFELNTFTHTEEQISSCRQVLAVLPADMPEGHPDTPTGAWAMTHTSHAGLHGWVSTTKLRTFSCVVLHIKHKSSGKPMR